MSMGFIKNGKYVQVAGNPPPSGELVTGISVMQNGTVALSVEPGSSGVQSIVFENAMPSDDYVVNMSVYNTGDRKVSVEYNQRRTTGFNIIYANLGSTKLENLTIEWTAFKLYTVQGLADLESEVAELSEAGIKVLWSGSATRGDTISGLSTAGYDEAYALVGGTWARLTAGANTAAGTRKKFTAVYAGRDTWNDTNIPTPYEQYYLLDILANGVIATCGWFNVANLNVLNARLAGQRALELAKSGGTWTDPTWYTLKDVETSIRVTKIVGVKYNKL